jgi:hypothetical protein
MKHWLLLTAVMSSQFGAHVVVQLSDKIAETIHTLI